MAARFFVDENDLALGKALAEVHGDVVYPGHPDLPEVPRGVLDDEWLPVVGAKGLIVITRDPQDPLSTRGEAGVGRASSSRVRPHRQEEPDDRDSRAILDRHWAAIESLVDDEPDGPWMQSVTEGGLRYIDLG